MRIIDEERMSMSTLPYLPCCFESQEKQEGIFRVEGFKIDDYGIQVLYKTSDEDKPFHHFNDGLMTFYVNRNTLLMERLW